MGQLAKRQAYAARLNLAYLAWQSGDAARALLLLEELRPRVDEDDWRGFDWYYLWRVCHPGLIGSWQTGGGQPFGLLFINEGTPSGLDSSELGETKRGESGAADSEPTTDVPRGYKPSVSVPTDVVPSAFSLGDSRPRKSGGGDSEPAGSRPSDAASRPASRVATLVTCGWTGIDIWDVADGGAASRRGSFATGNIWGIALSPDGKTLASGGTATDPFNIYYWDVLSGMRKPIPRGELSAVRGVAYSPDGRWLASAGATGVKVWVADTGVEVAHLAKNTSLRPIVFSPTGQYLAAGGELGAIHVWRCENGQFIGVAEIKAESGAIYSLSFSPDGSLLASSSRDVKLWSIPSGAPHSTAVASRMTTSCVQFSPDGRRLLTAGDDRYVRV
ncbi:MAG TPA: hypothetical protein PLV92_23485, partial [Pirellulaceae bacterium]|nr:hypothetical protein [Pirellulaceae bacterium]